MLFVKRLFYGTEEGYLSRIDGRFFPFRDGGRTKMERTKAERIVRDHVDGILRGQTAQGVPPRAGLKTRRKAYRTIGRQGPES